MPDDNPDRQRMLFSFWDGTADRVADPLAVGRKLERACPNYLELLKRVTASMPAELAALAAGPVTEDLARQKDEANEKLLAATRAAFGVVAVTKVEGVLFGLSERETAQLLADFLSWLAGAADGAAVFSTSRPRDAPSTPPASTTAPSAGSGTAGG